MIYETSKYTHDFLQFKTMRSFAGSIFNGKIILSEANTKQSNLLENTLEFNKSEQEPK